MRFAKYALLALVLAKGALADEQVVVIANNQAPVEKVSSDQVTQIFLRQVQTWPDGKAVYPVDIKEGSSLRNEFYSKVTGRSPNQLRAYWARQAFTGMGLPPKQVASADEANKTVRTTPGAIGYVGKKEADGPVKVVLDPNR